MKNKAILFASLVLWALLAVSLDSSPIYSWAQDIKVERATKADSIDKEIDIIKNKAPLSKPWSLLLKRAKIEGWRGSLNGPLSGLRTRVQQKTLYNKFIEGQGPPAFHPKGPSRHIIENVKEQGGWYQAIDVSRPEELIRVSESLGVDLWQPYADEPWHIEAKNPFAISVIGRESFLQSQEGEAAASFGSLVLIFLMGAVVSLSSSAKTKSTFFFIGALPVVFLSPLLIFLYACGLGSALLLSLLWARFRRDRHSKRPLCVYQEAPRATSAPLGKTWLDDVFWEWPKK